MSRIHGKNAFISIEDSTAASRSIQADSNTWDIDETVANPEMTAFNDNNVVRAGSGINDAKFNIAGWTNDAANSNIAILNGIKGRIGVLRIGPAGSAASAVQYAASVVMDSYKISSKNDSIVTFQASFSLASGSLTKTTF